MALGRREPTSELVHHADHGCQYISIEFTNRLADWKLSGSYGSVGDAFDNAAMHAFWATLKKEVDHIWGPIEGLPKPRVHEIVATPDPINITAASSLADVPLRQNGHLRRGSMRFVS